MKQMPYVAVVKCPTAPLDQLVWSEADTVESIDPNAEVSESVNPDAKSDGTLDPSVNSHQIDSSHLAELDALQLKKIQDDSSVEKAVLQKLETLRRSFKPAPYLENKPAAYSQYLESSKRRRSVITD